MATENKNAVEFFKTNPNVEKVFATTDGYVFVKKIDATNHAKTLNADSPAVETIENKGSKADEGKTVNPDKGLSPAEKKALKEKVTKEYTAIFGAAPDEKLSAAKIQELIDAKKTELAKDSGNENN